MNDGIEEIEVKGVLRGFKFGPRAIAVAEREDGCKAGELFEKMAAGDQLATLNVFYGAALDYCKVKNKKVDFNASDVADWFYEMGIEKSTEMLMRGLETFTEKNVKPPKDSLSGSGQ